MFATAQIITMIAVVFLVWQGINGEWAPIVLLPAFLVSLPAGALALVMTLITRSGVPRLRKISIVMSVAAVVSPFWAAFCVDNHLRNR